MLGPACARTLAEAAAVWTTLFEPGRSGNDSKTRSHNESSQPRQLGPFTGPNLSMSRLASVPASTRSSCTPRNCSDAQASSLRKRPASFWCDSMVAMIDAARSAMCLALSPTKYAARKTSLATICE